MSTELSRRDFTKSIAALFAGLSAGITGMKPVPQVESAKEPLPVPYIPFNAAYQYSIAMGLSSFGMLRTDKDDLVMTFSDESKKWESDRLVSKCGKAEYQFVGFIYLDERELPAFRADCKLIRGRDIYGIAEA